MLSQFGAFFAGCGYHIAMNYVHCHPFCPLPFTSPFSHSPDHNFALGDPVGRLRKEAAAEWKAGRIATGNGDPEVKVQVLKPDL